MKTTGENFLHTSPKFNTEAASRVCAM